jgi:Sec-independent protein translocase protein TatA
MGFFSDLKTLASDIGDIAKDFSKEIGDIVEDTKQEIKDDPKKYAVESLKDVGSAAVTVGKFAVDSMPAVVDAMNQQNERMAKKIEKAQKDKK